MGRIILITGGARSGKSTYAENIAKSLGNEIMYIATSVPFDEEMKDRIRKHRERRPSFWHTYEAYKNLKRVYSENKNSFDVILLDCITVMISNLFFDSVGDNADNLSSEEINSIEKDIMAEISDFINTVQNSTQPAILVTNELGCGIVPEYKSGRFFRDIAGRANQYIASKADEVYMTVCGIPIKIK